MDMEKCDLENKWFYTQLKPELRWLWNPETADFRAFREACRDGNIDLVRVGLSELIIDDSHQHNWYRSVGFALALRAGNYEIAALLIHKLASWQWMFNDVGEGEAEERAQEQRFAILIQEFSEQDRKSNLVIGKLCTFIERKLEARRKKDEAEKRKSEEKKK